MALIPSTHGVGYIEAPFSYLRAMLGEPIYKKSYQGHDYKSDVVWQIIIQSGPIEIVRIYNYKDGKNYLGEKGKKPEQITRWCVGGSNPEYAVDYVINRLHVELK